MPIKFRCGTCTRPMAIASRKIGTLVQCPHCKTSRSVPQESDAGLNGLQTRKDSPSGSAHDIQALESPAAPPPVAAQHQAPMFAATREVLPNVPVSQPAPRPAAVTPPPASAPAPVARREVLPNVVTPAAANGAASAPPVTDLTVPSTTLPETPASSRGRNVALGIFALMLVAGLSWGTYYVLSLDSGDGSDLHARVSDEPDGKTYQRSKTDEIADITRSGGLVQTLIGGPRKESGPEAKGTSADPGGTKVPEIPPLIITDHPPEKAPVKKETFEDLGIGKPSISEDELFRKALQNAKEALDAENYEQAVNWFNIAANIRQTDEVLKGLQEAESGRIQFAALEEARKKVADREKKLVIYERHMMKGQGALFLEEFDRATDSFTKARELFPDDVQALAALRKVEEARYRRKLRMEEEDARDKLEKERLALAKRLQETGDFKQVMKDGLDFYLRGKFREAMAAFDRARTIRPGSEDAQNEWKRAKLGLENEQALERAREIEENKQRVRKKLEDEAEERKLAYNRYMNDGKLALRKGENDAAVYNFALALEMNPKDPEAMQFRGKADKAREEINLAQAKREKAVIEEAMRNAQEAARKADELEKTEFVRRKTAEANQRMAQFQQNLIDGRLFMAQGQFQRAMDAFGKARNFQPGDQGLIVMLDQARRGMNDQDAAQAMARKHAEELAKAKDDVVRKKATEQIRLAEENQAKEIAKRKKAELQQLVLEGNRAFQDGKLEMALGQLEAARQLNPDDKNIADQIRKTRKALDERLAEEAVQRKKHEERLTTLAMERKREQDRLEDLQAKQRAKDEAQREARAYEKLVLDAHQAFKRGQIDTALELFSRAKGKNPNDTEVANLVNRTRKAKEDMLALRAKEEAKAAQDAQRLAEQKNADEASRKAVAEAEAQAKRFKSAMAQGSDAFRKGNYAEAMTAYSTALALKPGDAGAQDGLRKAQDGRETALAQARAKADQDEAARRQKSEQLQAQKQIDDFARHLGFGTQALRNKQWNLAISSFRSALGIKPGDAEAQAGLEQATEGQNRAQLELQKNTELYLAQKRAKEEADRKKDLARQEALAKARAETEKKTKARIEQNEGALNGLLATARAALELRKIKLAEDTLDAADKVSPGHPTILKLRDLAKRLAQLQADTGKELVSRELFQTMPLDAGAEKAVRETKVNLHLDDGNRALTQGAFADAAREFEAVLMIAPSHPRAADLLKKAKAGKQ